MKLSNKGFSLLELMVTAGILLIVISGMLVTFVYCILLNESNNNLVTAANDAQYVLEEIEDMAYSQQYTQIPNFINNFNSSTFTNLNSEAITFPNPVFGTYISEVTVNVGWTERQRGRSFSLSTQVGR